MRRTGDVEDLPGRLEGRHPVIQSAREGHGVQTGRQVQLVGYEHVRGEGELVPPDRSCNVGDRVHAIQGHGGRVDVVHGEPGSPDDGNPDQVAMQRVDDPVLVWIDEDGRRLGWAGRRLGGLGDCERILGEEGVADPDVVRRSRESRRCRSCWCWSGACRSPPGKAGRSD